MDKLKRELTLRIILEKPTPGVDFGLQKGKGSGYETVQKQRSNGDDLRFEFTVALKPGRDAGVDFTAPFVQGPASQRFVYIDIGTHAGQKNTPWSRRLKIPLSGITSKTIDTLLRDSNLLLETRVPGTGRDGGPNCATVKPFPGWSTAKR
jgi:hypothetical protein